MLKWTEKQVIDSAWAVGIAEDKALEFYHHYNSQGWVFGNGLPIKDLASALVRWKNNKYRWGKSNGKTDEKKTKLYPIPGKMCSVRGCGMPAVFKDTSGSYDHYKCSNHLPEKIKKQYE